MDFIENFFKSIIRREIHQEKLPNTEWIWNLCVTAPQNEWLLNGEPHLPDVLPPVQSNEDWQAAFGFATGHSGELSDDSVS